MLRRGRTAPRPPLAARGAPAASPARPLTAVPARLAKPFRRRLRRSLQRHPRVMSTAGVGAVVAVEAVLDPKLP